MGMIKLILEDFKIPRQDPAFISKWELVFGYSGMWIIIMYRVAHKLHHKGLKIIARMIMGFGQILTGIDIHPACTIGRRVF